jgi:hypothetical protein
MAEIVIYFKFFVTKIFCADVTLAEMKIRKVIVIKIAGIRNKKLL